MPAASSATPLSHLTIEIQPKTIYGIGRNYGEHAKELNNPVPEEPVVFLKAPLALRPLAAGPLAFADETFHHEAEMVLLIDKFIPMNSRPTENDVAAVGLGLDLTRRDVQTKLKAKGLPWTTAKSFAGAALVSEFLPRASFGALGNLSFTLTINGELRQTGHTKDMLFTVPTILAFLTTLGPLQAGDLIFTGTPAGVGPIKCGDEFVLEWLEPKQRYVGKL
jgi:2-keto-4-pentenoate hydratase/2-oxohepta-3-ene-1,7-dioic acid hydratase in catechol pathway